MAAFGLRVRPGRLVRPCGPVAVGAEELRQPLVIHHAEASMTRKPTTPSGQPMLTPASSSPRPTMTPREPSDHATPLVGAQVGPAKGRRELRVLGVEGALHLLEQSLLVLGERHGSSLRHRTDRPGPSAQHKQASAGAKAGPGSIHRAVDRGGTPPGLPSRAPTGGTGASDVTARARPGSRRDPRVVLPADQGTAPAHGPARSAAARSTASSASRQPLLGRVEQELLGAPSASMSPSIRTPTSRIRARWSPSASKSDRGRGVDLAGRRRWRRAACASG